MKEWARSLYLSKAWRETRKAYMAYRHGMCERCNKPAEIVHHKKHLTPRNIDNPAIALAWDNLECVCRECHALIHEGGPVTVDGLRFDENGDLIPPYTANTGGK